MWHPSTDKSATVRDIESSSICQGTQKEPYPPLCWVKDMQTSVLAMDPIVACDLALAHLGHGPGFPGDNCHRQACANESNLVEIRSAMKFQHTATAIYIYTA